MPPPNAKPEPIEDDEIDAGADEQINLDDEQTPQEGATINPDEEDAVEKELKSLDNKAFAAMRKEASELKRQNAEMTKRMQEYEARQNQPVRADAPMQMPQQRREMIGGVVVPQSKAEWDALARQDWQTAVDMRAIISARRVQEEVRKVDASTKVLDESKQRVLARHPELAETNNEKAQIYISILDRNPEYLTMSKGPILAMRDMEEELEARGYSRDQIFDSKQAATRNEATRVSRAALTTSGRTPERQGKSITLSKDELEFCRSNDLNPKDFARKKLEQEQSRKGAQL